MKNFFFEYFYYRLTEINTNKGEFQGVPAAVVISLIQVLLMLNVMIIVFEFFIDHSLLKNSSLPISNIAVIGGLILIIYNYRKYSKRYESIMAKWKDEEVKSRTLKGFLIGVVIVLSFVPLLLVTILK